jgi:anti-sigma-K factor RskA
VDDCEQRELTAGYALGALDRDDASRFEAHLRRCKACAAEVEAFRDALLVLAHTAEPAEPPAELRGRILAEVAPRAIDRPRRSFRSPFRWPLPALATGLAAAAACTVIVVVGTQGSGAGGPAALLGEPVAAEVALQPTGIGRILVGRDGKVVAQVTLHRAPAGKAYEAWVMPKGDAQRARPAGLLRGDGTQTVVLSARAHQGDVVGFTLEPAGGSPRPTSPPVATAHV